MLNRLGLLLWFWLLAITASAGQNHDSDSQTLHEILVELRAIHEDMRVSETTQLLIAELEMQQAVVNQATTEANARTKVNGIHQDQKQIAAELDHAQDQLDKTATPDERNAIAQDFDRRKENLAGLKAAEREWNSTSQDMQQRLQNAQDKLASITFPDEESYRRYRQMVKAAPECQSAAALVRETRCFSRYERLFLQPVQRA